MSPSKQAPRRPVVLVIMDGVGHNPSTLYNAVSLAKTPNLDQLYANNPLTVIEASGAAVGLPPGQMGNSEVGHLTLGAGKILRQDLVRINDEVDSGSLYDNPALLSAVAQAKANQRSLHLLGLVSDGGIHSHVDHLLALIELAKRHGVRPVVHMITDGRDTAPQSATSFLRRISPALNEANGAVASVCGRFYAMDRDKRWERVELAWRLLTQGEGERVTDAQSGIEQAWAAGQTDEFIRPLLTADFEAIGDQDAVIFFNFRNDRPRELTEALCIDSFDGFERPGFSGGPKMVTLTEYSPEYGLPVAFRKDSVEQTLGDTISRAGIQQFHTAETEKYPHVTFFFNGGLEAPIEGEERVLVPSPKVNTYDEQPEMSAHEVAQATLEAIRSERYGFIVVNFANGDMVGHTGVLEAAIKAMETLDGLVGQVAEAAEQHGHSIIITADHGNCDLMRDPISGGPHTQHTTFPVPCMIRDKQVWRLTNGGGLSSIAPTVLQLMGLEQPASMTGKSLLLEPLE